ncbi:MAG: hypothetical protein MI975_02300 [Cytophagales bacterium]|nr:hypothetical protein [Cytophagales bacterium]
MRSDAEIFEKPAAHSLRRKGPDKAGNAAGNAGTRITPQEAIERYLAGVLKKAV